MISQTLILRTLEMVDKESQKRPFLRQQLRMLSHKHNSNSHRPSTKYIFSFLLRIVTAALIFFSVVTSISAQMNEPADLRNNLKLVETISPTNDVLDHVNFTEENDLFITTQSLDKKSWKYRLGATWQPFAPCNNQNYTGGTSPGKQKLYIVGCPNKIVEVWDLKNGKKVLTFQLEKDKYDKGSDEVFPDISSDGKRIIIKHSGIGEEAELWDGEEGGKIANLTSSAADCYSCNRTVYSREFSPDSKTVAIAFGAMVFLWSAETGEPLNRLMDDKLRLYSGDFLSHNSPVSQILFTRDSKTVFTGSYDGIVKSWDVETGKLLHIFKGHNNRIEALALSPDGQTLATGSRDEKFKLWDVASGRFLLTSASHKKRVWILQFSPDGKRILSMTDNQTFIWDVKTATLLEKMPTPGELGTRFTSDWKFVLVTNRAKKVVDLYRYQALQADSNW